MKEFSYAAFVTGAVTAIIWFVVTAHKEFYPTNLLLIAIFLNIASKK